MRLEFLGTDSRDGDCPTLYRTDRGTIVVQGYKVTDPEALADLRDLADDETVVEIPEKLLRFARKEGSP
ncbi:hypothetical protein [Nocardiopsis sp. NRRL B-16309]|uniref:hypothetical protein n=1 Tax=Nocardiopsis sp. NRRL B-16309 TaxID=1519494 RepID=UPI0006AF96AD|nr:hypothetical protein [Nocardiopsis sp. NRRL B-16309]KOX11253.1 hypothetical protein ADL05_23760 [Nocardiopsis sp. NRRL B-16309]